MATVRAVPSPVSDVESRINSLTQAFVRAFNDRDLDTLASMYAQDAIVLPPNQRSAPGPMAIRELFGWYHDMGATNLKLENNHIVHDTEFVLTTGTYSITVPTPTGIKFNDHGKFVCNYQRQSNGDYKLLFDIWNSDLPPVNMTP